MGFADVFSDISAFSNPFGPPSNGEWNLSKGIYTNSKRQQMVFFIESKKGEDPTLKTAMDQVTDSGGRRLVKYEYPYVNGQRLDDLGKKGETYTFNIKFFGLNYQSKYKYFIRDVVNDPGPGILLHPTYSALVGGKGSIPVRFESYEIVHRHDEWNCVTIKATFLEDHTGYIKLLNFQKSSKDSILRQALQILTNAQAFIGNTLFSVGALLLLPGALKNSLLARLNSITGAVSRLLGQLSATFSSNSTFQGFSAQSASLPTGGKSLNSGTTSSGTLIPPVYQSGLDPTAQKLINDQIQNFINSNQITVQQAVFLANQIRAEISAAIAEINAIFGNDGYSIVQNYRELAVALQDVVESCVSDSQTQVQLYTVPKMMSLRMIAKENGLDPERQNDIAALNPYLGSVNLVPRGTVVSVPAA